MVESCRAGVLMLVAMLVASLLSGCGSSDPKPSEGPAGRSGKSVKVTLVPTGDGSGAISVSLTVSSSEAISFGCTNINPDPCVSADSFQLNDVVKVHREAGSTSRLVGESADSVVKLTEHTTFQAEFRLK